jgi:hypothetical protein
VGSRKGNLPKEAPGGVLLAKMMGNSCPNIPLFFFSVYDAEEILKRLPHHPPERIIKRRSTTGNLSYWGKRILKGLDLELSVS